MFQKVNLQNLGNFRHQKDTSNFRVRVTEMI
jgi:hypothetical protein